MAFDELPSRVATIWGTRTLSMHRLETEIEESGEYQTDGRRKKVVGAGDVGKIIDLQDGENVRLRAATMDKKRQLLKRYQDKCKTDRNRRIHVVDMQNFKRYTKNVCGPILMKVNFVEKLLKKVEGKFGFIILSYFHFIRWLFSINFLLSFFLLFSLAIPQTTLTPRNFLDNNFCSNDSIKVDKFTREACNMTRSYYKENLDAASSVGQSFVDFLQGTGWMEKTIMFYGSYFDKISDSHYNTGLSFLLSIGVYFFIFFIFTVAYSASSIRQRMLTYKKLSNLSPSHVPTLPLAEKLFTGWDFAITDQTQANYCHKYVTKTILEVYNEIIRHRNRRLPTLTGKIKLWTTRIIINIFIIFLILLSLTGIIASIVTQPTLLASETVKHNNALKLLCSFIPAICVVFFNFVMSEIFTALIKFEHYSPETQLNLMLLRSVLINLASVITLVITIGIQLVCGHKQPCIENVPCWETYVGQQLYKLSLVDFIVDIISVLLEFVRRKLVDRFPQNKIIGWIGYQSFNMPKNIIDAIYKQAVCWLGIFVAPMISIITTLKFMILFCIKSFTVLVNCKPNTTEQTSFESKYFFAVVLLLTLFICSAMNVFAIGRILPSQSCGPYRIFTKDDHYMYTITMDMISSLPSSLQTFIWFLGTWTFFVIVMVILSLFFLFYLSLVGGNKKLAGSLEDQLVAMKSVNQQYRKEILALQQRLGSKQF